MCADVSLSISRLAPGDGVIPSRTVSHRLDKIRAGRRCYPVETRILSSLALLFADPCISHLNPQPLFVVDAFPGMYSCTGKHCEDEEEQYVRQYVPAQPNAPSK